MHGQQQLKRLLILNLPRTHYFYSTFHREEHLFTKPGKVSLDKASYGESVSSHVEKASHPEPGPQTSSRSLPPQQTSPIKKPGFFKRTLQKLYFFKKAKAEAGPLNTGSALPLATAIPEKSLTRGFLNNFSGAFLIEYLLVNYKVVKDVDLAKFLAKSSAIAIYTFATITALGTFGIDTKPLLTGIGITGFTLGFALKEIATNFLSGIMLIFQKPFEKGSQITIHGSGQGIQGIVASIDTRYVILKVSESSYILIPSSIVYSNPISVSKVLTMPLISKPPTDKASDDVIGATCSSTAAMMLSSELPPTRLLSSHENSLPAPSASSNDLSHL